MGIEDIQISEELKTNAPSIKYRGNEGPKSPQEMQQKAEYDMQEYIIEFENVFPEMKELRGTDEYMNMLEDYFRSLAKGPILPSPEDPVNPFGPKPQGPVLPNRQMAAYGGIMGLDGRKQYGIGSWFQENIMDPIKNNPEIAAAAALYGLDTFEVPGVPGTGGGKINKTVGSIYNNPTVQDILYGKETNTNTEPSSTDIGKSERSGGIVNSLIKNLIPIAGGAAAGLFTKGGGQDASTMGTPNDQTGIQLADLKKTANILDQKQGMAAGLNFLPTVASRKYTPAEMIETYATAAANGGRIGYNEGNAVIDYENDTEYKGWKSLYEVNKDVAAMSPKHKEYENYYMSQQNMKAEGGIMDLGGMEKLKMPTQVK